VGAGVAGFIFVIGSMAIFLIGAPASWIFMAAAIVLGTAIATVFQWIHECFIEVLQPLSCAII